MVSLESKLLEIQSKFQQSPSWGWDNRYQCLLAVLTAEEAGRFYDHLGEIFEQAWGEKFDNTDYLPEVQKLIDVFESLRPEQSLYTIQESDGLIYATTWPWARSTQVSFRMGFFQAEASSEDRAKHKNLLQRIYWEHVFDPPSH